MSFELCGFNIWVNASTIYLHTNFNLSKQISSYVLLLEFNLFQFAVYIVYYFAWFVSCISLSPL